MLMHKKLFRDGSIGIGSRRIVYERGCFDRGAIESYGDPVDRDFRGEPIERREVLTDKKANLRKESLFYTLLFVVFLLGFFVGVLASVMYVISIII